MHSSNSPIRDRTGFFYGWYILISCFFILFFNSGARFTIGVMFKPMIAEFGWNRGSFSLAFFLHMAVFSLSLIVVGKLYDRYGPKWVIIISTILLSFGYLGLSRIHVYWQFIVFYSFLTALGLGGTSVPLISALISKWFKKRRGLAISTALSGSSLGQFALVPLFTIFLLDYGWRPSYFLVSIVTLLINVSLALLFVRGDPEDLGVRPYGDEAGAEHKTLRTEAIPNDRLQDMDFKDAIRTPSLWLFVTVMFICGSGDFLVSTHLVPWATDAGISATTAGNMLAWFGLMSLGGLLVAGPVADRFGMKIPMAITFLIRTAIFFMVLKYESPFFFYIFAMAFGFTFAVTAPYAPMMVGKLYGVSHVGILSGFIATIHHSAGGFWAYMGGVFFDRTGNYEFAFLASAIMAFVASLSSLFIREKRHYPKFQR